MNNHPYPALFLNPKYHKYFTMTEILHINRAYIFTNSAHRNQKRDDGSPYIYHPMRMVEILLGEFHIYDAELVIALLFHDVQEESCNAFANAMVMMWFGLKHGENMTVLTKTRLNKKWYLKRILECGIWQIILAKLIDRLDNMQTLEKSDKKFQEKQARETRELFLPLCAELAKVIPKQYMEVAPVLRIRLSALCERYGC